MRGAYFAPQTEVIKATVSEDSPCCVWCVCDVCVCVCADLIADQRQARPDQVRLTHPMPPRDTTQSKHTKRNARQSATLRVVSMGMGRWCCVAAAAVMLLCGGTSSRSPRS